RFRGAPWSISDQAAPPSSISARTWEQLVHVQLAVQLSTRDAELARGAADVAARLRQRSPVQLSLELTQRADGGRPPRRDLGGLPGQAIEAGVLEAREVDLALDPVLQLSHVPWPRVRLQRAQRFRADRPQAAAVRGRMLAQEMLRQRLDVLPPLAQ